MIVFVLAALAGPRVVVEPLEGLLSEVSGAECAAAPASALVPLHGAAHQGIPRVTGTVPRWEAAEPREVSWARVAEVRAEVFGARTIEVVSADGAASEAARHYELGALHRELGHQREAAHYFAAAAAGAPAGAASLQRAAALGGLGAWDEARDALAEAARLGAAPRDVLVGLGTVSLVSGAPEPARVGRALLAADADDALAGALLLRAGCWSEAIRPLARADAPWARLLLADAHLLAGEADAARAVLADLSASDAPGALPGLVRARRRLLALVDQRPSGWPSLVPALERAAAGSDDAEAREALFLLAQIGEHLGDDDVVIEASVALVDRDERLLDEEPGARLARAWARRTGALLAARREVDVLAAHLEAWRPGLERHLAEPGALVTVAEAWRRLGLHEEELETLGELGAVEARDGRDDRATVLSIAGAYHRTGRLPEALEALDFLATRPRDPTFDARAGLLRGRVLLASGDPDGARAAWLSVHADLPEGAEARVRLALHDAEAGRCAGDVADVLSGPGPDDLPPGRIAAARVSCLAALGRADEARAAALEADAALTDAGTRAFVAAVGGVRVEGPWARLAAEDEAHAALLARLRGATGGPARDTAPSEPPEPPPLPPPSGGS